MGRRYVLITPPILIHCSLNSGPLLELHWRKGKKDLLSSFVVPLSFCSVPKSLYIPLLTLSVMHIDALNFIAQKDGRFAAELAALEVKGKKGMEQFSVDEHPRETTLDKLLSLKAVFKENGVVTAGNASVSSRLVKRKLFGKGS